MTGEDFVCIRDMFFDDHCKMFEDKEENKLEYTSIFENYVSSILFTFIFLMIFCLYQHRAIY